MVIKTTELDSIKPFFEKLFIPKKDSHKGQNGRVLVIGGSSLFHSSSIWAAEVAAHFSDLVHYSSTRENNEIFLSLKKKFRNGIVVAQKDLMSYVQEDDAILVGPGMMREGEEGKYSHDLTKKLIENFPNKQFVFDAGAIQMMEPGWLLKLKIPAILTPHKGEYQKLFGDEIPEVAAKKYHCVILLKNIDDTVTDGKTTVTIIGGNQGLTKGGTGDILAGLVLALAAKNDPTTSCILASYIIKRSADKLAKSKGYWYNINNLIEEIPITLTQALNL
jgi:NAD(P)H-hydrate epimerase